MKYYRDHQLFDKAEKKYKQEIDIVRIVKTLKSFRMFA